MLARLNFLALRRRAQLGIRQSHPDGIGAVVFAAARSWLCCKAPLIYRVVGKSNAADTPKSEQDALTPWAGKRSSRWPLQEWI